MEIELYTHKVPISYDMFYIYVIYGVLLVVFIEYSLFEIRIKKIIEKMDILVKENEQLNKKVNDIELIEMRLLKEKLEKLNESNEKRENRVYRRYSATNIIEE